MAQTDIDIHDTIETILAYHGLTFRALAQAMQVYPSSLSRTLRRNPTVSTLGKVAVALDIHVFYLLYNPTRVYNALMEQQFWIPDDAPVRMMFNHPQQEKLARKFPGVRPPQAGPGPAAPPQRSVESQQRPVSSSYDDRPVEVRPPPMPSKESVEAEQRMVESCKEALRQDPELLKRVANSKWHADMSEEKRMLREAYQALRHEDDRFVRADTRTMVHSPSHLPSREQANGGAFYEEDETGLSSDASLASETLPGGIVPSRPDDFERFPETLPEGWTMARGYPDESYPAFVQQGWSWGALRREGYVKPAR